MRQLNSRGFHSKKHPRNKYSFLSKSYASFLLMSKLINNTVHAFVPCNGFCSCSPCSSCETFAMINDTQVNKRYLNVVQIPSAGLQCNTFISEMERICNLVMDYIEGRTLKSCIMNVSGHYCDIAVFIFFISAFAVCLIYMVWHCSEIDTVSYTIYSSSVHQYPKGSSVE